MLKENMISITDLDQADGGLEMLRLSPDAIAQPIHLDGGARTDVPLIMGEVMLLANTGTDPRLLEVISRVLSKGQDLLERRNEAAMERYIEAALDFVPMARADALLSEARADFRARFLQTVPCLTSADVHRIGGARGSNKSQRAARLKTQGKVFAVRYSGQDYFPAFQFDDDGQPYPVMAALLRALPKTWSPWEIGAWFAQRNFTLDGAVPRDLVASADARLIPAAQAAEERAIG
ncbi:hypothetical protein ACSSNL_16790 [Thalassobius sp. S69A]|uniref:hypothetical protein n=1 Tax=unclassified Thalassovita TaxID=2619711 RepID=UPI000C4BF6D5|nr:hypothetical protein [Paracoccaceae bacterium]